MNNKSLTIQSLALLIILTAISLTIAFILVYYVTIDYNNRPTRYYGIVIDAGSTQTRSALYTLSAKQLDSSSLHYKQTIDHHPNATAVPALSDVLQIDQVSSCVNGGPLASINSTSDARQLMKGCLEKFIKMIESTNQLIATTENQSKHFRAGGNGEIANSETHLYLGATAGMRSLQAIDNDRAKSIISTTSESIDKLGFKRLVNKDYIGILTGPEEALYAWLSVNYLCKRLVYGGHGKQLRQLKHNHLNMPISISESSEQQTIVPDQTNTIGTLELGGSSGQMTFEVLRPDSMPLSGNIDQEDYINQHMFKRTLFNRAYQIKTRSDLCIGLTQTVLRTNMILLADYHYSLVADGYSAGKKTNSNDTFISNTNVTTRISKNSNNHLIVALSNSTITLAHPCLQNNSLTPVTNVAKLLSSTCLLSPWSEAGANYLTNNNNNRLKAINFNEAEERAQQELYEEFFDSVADKTFIFKGIGDKDQCVALIDKLIDTSKCRKYFALCPKQPPNMKPPPNVPFVAISGYNKVLEVLDLTPSDHSDTKHQQEQISNNLIKEELGGRSVLHDDLVTATKKICQLDTVSLQASYPKLKQPFLNLQCLELIYIERLLTKYYLFDPQTSWSQLKFLIFPPTKSNNLTVLWDSTSKQSNTSLLSPLSKISNSTNIDHTRNEADLSWTLGLLLNATNYGLIDLKSPAGSDDTKVYHHPASLFSRRLHNSVFLMLAASLIAMSLIFVALIFVQSRRQTNLHYTYTGRDYS